MRRVRKLVALLLSLAMVLAMSGVAMASSPVDLNGGEAGGFTAKDTPNLDNKVVNIAKEIKVFNPDESKVYGPAITYSYSIAAASGAELVTITDATTDHDSGNAVTTTAKAGITTGVVMTGTAANTIEWTNADLLDASSAGAQNYKYLAVDFSAVVFQGPGVYRYKITESANAYVTSGVSDGGISEVRYLDVYVMRSSTFNTAHDGSTANPFVADDWTVYGYVCISPESVASSAGGTTNVTPDTIKTNGFVAATLGTTSFTADEYRTYNLTVGKTLVGDNIMSTHGFPFDVAWTAGTATGTFQFGYKATDATLTNTTDGTLKKVGGADAVDTGSKDGDPKIASGGSVKYIGIPNGTKATVTETNDVIGTTYVASIKETVGTGSATEVATGSVDYNGTLSYAQNDAPANDTNVTIQVTNTLETISPTGLMFRYGPYVLILLCGALLLFLGVKFTRRNKEED